MPSRFFYDRMSAEQRAALAKAIAEADKGESVSPAELETRLQTAIAKSGA